MESVATHQKNIHQFWEEMEENLKDAIKKINSLKTFKTNKGLSVVKYPSGLSFQTLQKVCRVLEQKDPNFQSFEYLLIEAGHHSNFHLVRNASSSHRKFENFYQETGGILSEKIIDFGDLRIVHSDDSGKITEGADFSLYRTKDDDFVI